jgi:Protein of unknown function (DUF3168)
MSDPSLPLQAAIVAQLKAGGGIAGVGDRVFDEPKPTSQFPYIVVGDMQVEGDDSDCADASVVFSQVHVWSRAKDFIECKTIAAAARDRLKAVPALAGFIVTVAAFEQARVMRDPDGITRHGVVEHRYLIIHA